MWVAVLWLAGHSFGVVDLPLLWVHGAPQNLPANQPVGVGVNLLMDARAGPGPCGVVGLWLFGIVAILVLLPLVLKGLHALDGQLWR